MLKTTVYCDCCRNEIPEPRSWEFDPRPFKVSVETSCQNPLGDLEEAPGYQAVTLEFKHTCYNCSRRLAQAIATVINEARHTA